MLDALGYPQTYLAGDWRQEMDVNLPDRQALERWLLTERPDWVVSAPQQSKRLHLTPELFTAFLSARGYRSHVCPSPSLVIVYVRD